MSTDIHDKIRSEVERRLAIAQAATEGGGDWYVGRKWNVAIAEPTDLDEAEPLAAYGVAAAFSEHIALHDPADAIRRYSHALWILGQHQWVAPGVKCACNDAMCSHGGHIVWPCDDILRLAESLGIDTGGTDG